MDRPSEKTIGFGLLAVLAGLAILIFTQPCFSQIPVIQCISPETLVAYAEVAVIATLTFLIYLTYVRQNEIQKDQRDMTQAQHVPQLVQQDDYKLTDARPDADGEVDSGRPGDWFSVKVINQGNEMANGVWLLLLLRIDEQPVSIPPSTEDGEVNEVTYGPTIQKLNDARAQSQTEERRPAAVFTNSDPVRLRTTISVCNHQRGEAEKSPFVDALRNILIEAEPPQPVTFGFVLLYTNQNNRIFDDELQPAYRISPDEAEDIEGEVTLEAIKEQATLYPMEDLYGDIEELRPFDDVCGNSVPE
jgi:hypothetical protein